MSVYDRDKMMAILKLTFDRDVPNDDET
jgi:hypothetical protein